MTDTQNILAFAGILASILACIAVWRFHRHWKAKRKKHRDALKKLIHDKNECILHVTALLKQEPTHALRTDPYTIVLWYGASRIVHRRQSWNDSIMLYYADGSHVAIHLTNGIIPGITLSNQEEWIIRDIRHILRKWEHLPQAQTA